MSQAGSTVNAAAAGFIQTINGDTGSITGNNVTIYTNNAAVNSGSTIKFTNSGTISTLNVTDASDNTIFGKGAGNLTLSNGNNTGFGKFSLNGLTTGSSNTAFGSLSLVGCTTSPDNTAIGAGSIFSLTTGSGFNSALGNTSLNQLATGSYNVAIGSFAGINYTGAESSNILISNRGTLGESNVIRIGTTGSGNQQQNKCYVAGIDGVNVGSVATVVTESGGQLGTAVITAGSNITVTPGANTITIAASGGGTTCIFSAYLSSTQSNVTGDGTVYTIPFNTALVNTGGAYNTGTGVFTAPTTGNYLFTSSVNMDGLLNTHTDGIISLLGSAYENRFFRCNFGAIAAAGIVEASGSFIIPMNAGATMSVFLFVANGTKVVNVIGAAAPGTYTNFAGYLIL